MVESLADFNNDHIIAFFDPINNQSKYNSKRKRKKASKSPSIQDSHQHKLTINKIRPITPNQKHLFDFYKQGLNILSYGSAGTGKTFTLVYLALEEILSGNGFFKKLIIVRSTVPSRDQGFLPGDEKKKSAVYEAPYEAIVNELFNRKDAYNQLKQRGVIEFVSTSYLRGITMRDSIVILDEFQNLVENEEKTVITRMGNNTKLLIAGDIRQNDLENKKYERSSAKNLIRVIEEMKEFAIVEFNSEDIVRSGLVKSYIIAREKLGLD